MSYTPILEQMRRRITPELYEEIRPLWKKHSIAEDARDIPGLMSTLTEDCVYELPRTGHSWHGHEGAMRFYLSLLEALAQNQATDACANQSEDFQSQSSTSPSLAITA